MSEEVHEMFMMPMTFATPEFEAFVGQLNSWLDQIKLEDAEESISEIREQCEFYTKILAGMGPAVKCKTFEGSTKKHYKYNLKACKEAHEQLMLEDAAEKKYADQLCFKPAWGHLDGYVWGILSKCYTMLTHASLRMHDKKTFLQNYCHFLDASTGQLNETKKDMQNYILYIEGLTQTTNWDYLGMHWHLQTLITFKEGINQLPCKVLYRDWYIQPFTYWREHTPGGPAAGGGYATFKQRAHMTCDNIGGLLTRLEKL
jgi:hypothetical protein